VDKKQQIAIVGIGGVFPGGRNLDDYWDNILNARDLSREPPDGRWLLSPTECFSPGGPQPDKVYSRRACFVDDFDVDLSGLHIKPELVASLDPMFRLLLQAGKNAWHDVNTETIDTSRTGVILGNIALPTEASSALADELILPEIERQLGIDPVTNKPVNKLNRYVAGLPAGMLARSLGLGGGS
jgi:acyl transferase domain-containing protein